MTGCTSPITAGASSWRWKRAEPEEECFVGQSKTIPKVGGANNCCADSWRISREEVDLEVAGEELQVVLAPGVAAEAFPDDLQCAQKYELPDVKRV